MSHIQKYITQQSVCCRNDWFKDHKAKLTTPSVEISVLNWANPKSWNYGCRFIIHRRWLCIVGDIGEAVFEWSEDLTMNFLGKIDFGYFMSKCQAAPKGREFEDWDSKVAEKNLEEYIEELKAKPEDERNETHDVELERLREIGDYNHGEDFNEAARDIYHSTGDAELASSISDMGKVPSVHAIGMFIGLQMAIAQLNAANTDKPLDRASRLT